MTDNRFAHYETKCATAARLATEILPANKQVLFDALTAAGIVAVTISFDGSSDSGQFEPPIGFNAADEAVPVPEASIKVQTIKFELGIVEEQTTLITEFIETSACEFLRQKHFGWENGDGAYGEFRFTAEERTITLEFNERYVETVFHEHQF